MKQARLCLGNSTKRKFLDEMNRVAPWPALVELVAPLATEGRRGRPPFAAGTMLLVRFMQQWFTLSDLAMEEALRDVPLFREFAGLSVWSDRLPDESTILRFRYLLEKQRLAAQVLGLVNELLRAKGQMFRAGTLVNATLIAAPSSTKNASGERDPEMHHSKKGTQWYLGMKAHIRVDAESGLVHTVRGSSGHDNDVVEASPLLHGDEAEVFADAGYQGAHKRADAQSSGCLNTAMRPGKRAALDKTKMVNQFIDELERLKASIRTKVEHGFRVIKRQVGHVKVHDRGLNNNTAQLSTLFALSNLWMVRKTLQVLDGTIRVRPAKAA